MQLNIDPPFKNWLILNDRLAHVTLHFVINLAAFLAWNMHICNFPLCN